ncbi:MAG: hypothetical protein JXA44_09955 [Methanospirillaceae archaeon]|nr:hypothetical protein [Methanospirillaceae archaeon]
MRVVLGIRHGHDAAASLVINGQIVADVAEERLTRKKNDGSFPENAIRYCLKSAGITSRDLDAVVVPTASISETVRTFFPGGTIPGIEKRGLKRRLRNSINSYISTIEEKIELPVYYETFPVTKECKLIPVHHHLAHASSAYYTSGLFNQKTLVVVMDGIGDGCSTSLWCGERNHLTLLSTLDSTSSLAWFYAAATEALGWRHGSDEWKTMGLAPYGTPRAGALHGYYPEFQDGNVMVRHNFGEPGRFPDHGCNHYHLTDATPLQKKVEELGREHFAAEVQRVVEEQAGKLIYPWLKKIQTRNLCCAGGFFLNVKFNQKVWYSGNVDIHWVYPNPGDAGLAAGAALYGYFSHNSEKPSEKLTSMYLGPSYDNEDIRRIIDERKLRYTYHEDITDITAGMLADNKIIAWFQGRMESGPRALGNRSILMSPLKAENKDIINACVKYREAFRPFTPSMIHEVSDTYLLDAREESFMVTSFTVKEGIKERIPAVVHVDNTARPQMVKRESNPKYYDLIKKFGDITGEYVLLNTSFNIKGEPIICNPREAIRCFFDTGLDALVLGDYLLTKPGCCDGS